MRDSRSILAGLACLALLTAAAGHAATRTFADTRGEDAAAPDIATVVVSGTDAASFSVAVADLRELSDNVQLFIALDLDRNGSTGDRDGVDVLFQMTRRAGAELLRWTGSQFAPFGHAPIAATYAEGKLETTLPVTALGVGASFDFGVVAVRGSGAGQHADAAPDSGRWTFALRAPVTARVSAAAFSPATPVAGRRFALRRASLALSTGGMRVAASPRCTASIGGRKLTSRTRCSWLVPQSARGKTLAVSVTASANGVLAKRTFRFRVR